MDDGKRVKEPNHQGERRMLEIEEKKELRCNGRPLRELLSFYKSASDGDAVRFVEQEYRDG